MSEEIDYSDIEITPPAQDTVSEESDVLSSSIPDGENNDYSDVYLDFDQSLMNSALSGDTSGLDGVKGQSYNADFGAYRPYAKHGIINPFYNLDKQRANNQSVSEQIAVGTAGLAQNIVGGLIETAGYIGELPSHIAGNSDYTNAFVRAGAYIKDNNVLANLASKNGKGEIYLDPDATSFDVSNPSWWLKHGSQGVESIIQFAALGYGVGAVIKALGVGGAIANGINGAGRLSARALSGAGKISAAGKALSSSLRAAQVASNLVPNVLTSATLAFTEGAMSANQVYKDSMNYWDKLENQEELQSLSEQYNKQNNTNISTKEYGKMLASANGARTANISTILNTGLNAIQLAPLFRPVSNVGSVSASRINKAIRGVQKEVGRKLSRSERRYVRNKIVGATTTEVDAGLASIAAKYAAKTPKTNPALRSVILEDVVSESVEELNTLHAEKEGAKGFKSGDMSGIGGLVSFINNIPDYFENTMTEEGLTTGFWGGILGAGHSTAIGLISRDYISSYDSEKNKIVQGDKKVSSFNANKSRREAEMAQELYAIRANIDKIDATKKEIDALADKALDGTMLPSDLQKIKALQMELFMNNNFMDGMKRDTAELFIEDLKDVANIDPNNQMSEYFEEQRSALVDDLAELKDNLIPTSEQAVIDKIGDNQDILDLWDQYKENPSQKLPDGLNTFKAEIDKYLALLGQQAETASQVQAIEGRDTESGQYTAGEYLGLDSNHKQLMNETLDFIIETQSELQDIALLQQPSDSDSDIWTNAVWRKHVEAKVKRLAATNENSDYIINTALDAVLGEDGYSTMAEAIGADIANVESAISSLKSNLADVIENTPNDTSSLNNLQTTLEEKVKVAEDNLSKLIEELDTVNSEDNSLIELNRKYDILSKSDSKNPAVAMALGEIQNQYDHLTAKGELEALYGAEGVDIAKAEHAEMIEYGRKKIEELNRKFAEKAKEKDLSNNITSANKLLARTIASIDDADMNEYVDEVSATITKLNDNLKDNKDNSIAITTNDLITKLTARLKDIADSRTDNTEAQIRELHRLFEAEPEGYRDAAKNGYDPQAISSDLGKNSMKEETPRAGVVVATAGSSDGSPANIYQVYDTINDELIVSDNGVLKTIKSDSVIATVPYIEPTVAEVVDEQQSESTVEPILGENEGSSEVETVIENEVEDNVKLNYADIPDAHRNTKLFKRFEYLADKTVDDTTYANNDSQGVVTLSPKNGPGLNSSNTVLKDMLSLAMREDVPTFITMDNEVYYFLGESDNRGYKIKNPRSGETLRIGIGKVQAIMFDSDALSTATSTNMFEGISSLSDYADRVEIGTKRPYYKYDGANNAQGIINSANVGDIIFSDKGIFTVLVTNDLPETETGKQNKTVTVLHNTSDGKQQYKKLRTSDITGETYVFIGEGYDSDALKSSHKQTIDDLKSYPNNTQAFAIDSTKLLKLSTGNSIPNGSIITLVSDKPNDNSTVDLVVLKNGEGNGDFYVYSTKGNIINITGQQITDGFNGYTFSGIKLPAVMYYNNSEFYDDVLKDELVPPPIETNNVTSTYSVDNLLGKPYLSEQQPFIKKYSKLLSSFMMNGGVVNPGTTVRVSLARDAHPDVVASTKAMVGKFINNTDSQRANIVSVPLDANGNPLYHTVTINGKEFTQPVFFFVNANNDPSGLRNKALKGPINVTSAISAKAGNSMTSDGLIIAMPTPNGISEFYTKVIDGRVVFVNSTNPMDLSYNLPEVDYSKLQGEQSANNVIESHNGTLVKVDSPLAHKLGIAPKVGKTITIDFKPVNYVDMSGSDIDMKKSITDFLTSIDKPTQIRQAFGEFININTEIDNYSNKHGIYVSGANDGTFTLVSSDNMSAKSNIPKLVTVMFTNEGVKLIDKTKNQTDIITNEALVKLIDRYLDTLEVRPGKDSIASRLDDGDAVITIPNMTDTGWTFKEILFNDLFLQRSGYSTVTNRLASPTMMINSVEVIDTNDSVSPTENTPVAPTIVSTESEDSLDLTITPSDPTTEIVVDESFDLDLNDNDDDFIDLDISEDFTIDSRFTEGKSYTDSIRERETSWFHENISPRKKDLRFMKGNIRDNTVGELLSDGSVLISNTAPTGTVYHEAFERVWRNYLNTEQRDNLITELIDDPRFDREYDIVSKKYPDNNREGVIREMLAERFREYNLSKYTKSSTMRAIFDDIMKFFRNLLGLGPTIGEATQTIYNNINAGLYRNSMSTSDIDNEITKLVNSGEISKVC